MKITTQIIEEGIVQAKTIGINFDYDDGTSAEWLRLYSERLVAAVREETLQPFKGMRNPGEWEDGVWWQGRRDAIQRITKWVGNNATTKDTPISDFPEEWVYEVDANELIDYLNTLSIPTNQIV